MSQIKSLGQPDSKNILYVRLNVTFLVKSSKTTKKTSKTTKKPQITTTNINQNGQKCHKSTPLVILIPKIYNMLGFIT